MPKKKTQEDKSVSSEKSVDALEKDLTTLKRENKLLSDEAAEWKQSAAKLQEELDKTGEAVHLNAEGKASLVELNSFLYSLYKESEHPGVRKNIQDWRKLIAELC